MRLPARWSLVLLAALLAVPAPAQDEQGFNTPYYPLQVGNKWTYRADTEKARPDAKNRGGSQKVVVEVTKKEPTSRTVTKEKKDVKEKVASYVLKISSGDKTQFEQVAIFSDGVYRLQAAGKKIEPPLMFFKLPLKQGDSWEVDSTSEETKLKGTMKAGEAKVQVPAGAYQAMTVASKDFQIGPQAMEMQYWFAPNVGMVKQTVTLGGREITLELEKFEPAK